MEEEGDAAVLVPQSTAPTTRALSHDAWSTVVRLGEAWAAAEAATTSAGGAAAASHQHDEQQQHQQRQRQRQVLDDAAGMLQYAATTINDALPPSSLHINKGNNPKDAMQAKVQAIMDRQTEALDDPAPLVLFALRQRPEHAAAALDALEAGGCTSCV
jgi:hypothetical protein